MKAMGVGGNRLARTRVEFVVHVLRALCLWSFTVGISCSGSRSSTTARSQRVVPTAAEPSGLGTPDMRIVAITDLNGYLEPCGCTSRPLGGMDRFAYRLRELEADAVPTYFVAAGSVLDDPAHQPESEREGQERIRRATVKAALMQLHIAGYRDDPVECPRLGDGTEGECPNAFVFGNGMHEAAGQKLGLLNVFEAQPLDEFRAEVSRLREAGADVTMTAATGSRRWQRRVAEDMGVDFVIQGGVDEAVARAPATVGTANIIHAGRQGQGFVVLELYHLDRTGPFVDLSSWTRRVRIDNLEAQSRELEQRIREWESQGRATTDIAAQRERLASLLRESEAVAAVPAVADNQRAFVARYVELPFNGPKDPTITALMDQADREINQSNRTAFADLAPVAADADQPHFVGSDTCQTCHSAAYQWWRGHPHGHAYQTLVDRNKEFNLSCVGCHVTGYLRPGGSNVTHVGALADVGCENCHGAGSQHIGNPSAATVNVHRGVTEATCVGCHNQEHSDRFRFDAYVRTLRVPGHGLPQ